MLDSKIDETFLRCIVTTSFKKNNEMITQFFYFIISVNISLHIPKTGGSTLRATFKKCNNFVFPNHGTIPDKKCIHNYYAVIRNPYDRLFSTFTYYKFGSPLYNPAKNKATNLTFSFFS